MNARRHTDRTVLYIMSHPLSEVKCKICLFHEVYPYHENDVYLRYIY